MKTSANPALARFRELNDAPEVLVLPGAWDFVSARMLARLGVRAIGTTSTGICWSVGRAGGWRSFLAASERIVRSVDVPVSLDVEAGFGATPEEVAGHVREAIAVGACGINLEDGLGSAGPGDPALLAAKLRAVREVCDELDYPLYVNARTDVFLSGERDLADTVRRAQRYAEAGADMFFAPGLADADAIATLVREVPVPVNVYAGPGVPPVGELAELGVRRLSIGCGILQSALAHVERRTREVIESGAYAFSNGWLPFEYVDELCAE